MGGGTAHAVVRAAWNDQVIIKRLLDVGAQSLLIPYVETEEEAQTRRHVGSLPAGGLPRRRFADASLTLWQNKRILRGRATSRSAFSCKSKRSAGLRTSTGSRGWKASTACSSGRAIFRPGLGISANPLTPRSSRPSTIRFAGSRTPAPRAGILTADAKLAQHYIDAGCLFTAVGSDIGLLANAADQLAQMFRSQNPGR